MRAHTHTYTCTHTYTYTHTHTGLEIGGFASPIANHFWDNYESLSPTDLSYFFGHCESLLADCKSLFKWICPKTFFWSSPIFERNFLYKEQKCE